MPVSDFSTTTGASRGALTEPWAWTWTNPVHARGSQTEASTWASEAQGRASPPPVAPGCSHGVVRAHPTASRPEPMGADFAGGLDTACLSPGRRSVAVKRRNVLPISGNLGGRTAKCPSILGYAIPLPALVMETATTG